MTAARDRETGNFPTETLAFSPSGEARREGFVASRALNRTELTPVWPLKT